MHVVNIDHDRSANDVNCLMDDSGDSNVKFVMCVVDAKHDRDVKVSNMSSMSLKDFQSDSDVKDVKGMCVSNVKDAKSVNSTMPKTLIL